VGRSACGANRKGGTTVLAVDVCVHVRADFAAQLQAVRGRVDVFAHGSLQERLVTSVHQGATYGAIWHVLQAEARGDQVVFYLGTLVQKQRLAGDADVVLHRAPDLHGLSRADKIPLNGAVHCDAPTESDKIAPDGAVHDDLVGGHVHVVVDNLVRADHDLLPAAGLQRTYGGSRD